MKPPLTGLERFALRRLPRTIPIRLLMGLVAVTLTCSMAWLEYLLGFNLSGAASLHLLLVVLVALHFGLGEATVISITSVLCLDYLFTAPVFQFSVGNADNWISLATFEAAALLVSRLSSKLRLHADLVEIERARTATLYELSRAVLLIDTRSSVIDQLSDLIRELLKADSVDLWTLDEAFPTSPANELRTIKNSHSKKSTQTDHDDIEAYISTRVLRLGTTPIGMMVLHQWHTDPALADAVASLAALALERARALQQENRAEAARNTEQLRTAVLDGLAHGFKTPLTAIQTASSGLLAIGHLTETQTELASVIDEEVSMLAQLTTRLLQTAALDARQIQLHRTPLSIVALTQHTIQQQAPEHHHRLKLTAHSDLLDVEVDRQLVELAILQLIDNALKYSSVGSTIDVRITQDAFETKFAVTNSGSFIRAEERERVFERFYRSPEAVHGPTGTGLGLSIVKKMAEAHGGTAQAHSSNGITTISFTLQHSQSTRNK
jgi:two-component system sensor histidine kinase KdpD